MTEDREQLVSVIASVRDLDDQLDELQDERDILTDRLEQAAEKHYQARPSAARKGCCRCRFVYAGTEAGGDLIRFSLDCSWCGEDRNVAMRVNADVLAVEVAKDRATT